MTATILYCTVVNTANITFLHVDPDSEFQTRAECSPLVTTNSNSCSEELDAPSLQVDHGVRPLLIRESVTTRQLQSLEALCYPSVHIWCWILSTYAHIPPQCDGFIMATNVETESVFDELSSPHVKAFIAHEHFQTCNSRAILEPGRIHERVQGIALKYVGMNVSVYTNEPLPPPPNGPAFSSLEHVQGIERSVLEALADRHNFTVVPLRPPVSIHFKFKSLENETDWLHDSSMGLVIRKQAPLIFGDFSLVHPRQHFIDFTLPHLSEGFTLMAKASLRSLSAKDILFACGPKLFLLYASSAFFVSIAFHIRTRCRVKLSKLFFYVSTLLFQQSNRPSRRFRRATRLLDKTWRFSVFVLGCWLSARLVESLARGHLDGLLTGTLADFAEFLYLNRDARVFHHPRALFLDGSQTKEDEIVLERTRECKNCLGQFLEARVAFILEELSSNQRTFRLHMREELVYIHEQPLFFFYLAFGVPKNCFFRPHLDETLRILLEAGHIDRFKRRAGLETRSFVPAKLRRDFGLRKSSNFLYDLLPWLLFPPTMIFLIETIMTCRKKNIQISDPLYSDEDDARL